MFGFIKKNSVTLNKIDNASKHTKCASLSNHF